MKKSSKIFEDTTTGGAVINAGAHVDLPAGIFDRPGPQNPQNFGNKPIVPSGMVANQIAVVRPPIDDDEYRPTSKQELALSVSEISKTVPDSQISTFYEMVKELAQESIDNENVEELDEKSKSEMQESKNFQRTLAIFSKNVDKKMMNELRIFSAHECLDVMLHKGIISKSKELELRKKVHSVLDESLFKRFFFVSMIKPAVFNNLRESKSDYTLKEILKKYSALSVQRKIKIFENVCR